MVWFAIHGSYSRISYSAGVKRTNNPEELNNPEGSIAFTHAAGTVLRGTHMVLVELEKIIWYLLSPNLVKMILLLYERFWQKAVYRLLSLFADSLWFGDSRKSNSASEASSINLFKTGFVLGAEAILFLENLSTWEKINHHLKHLIILGPPSTSVIIIVVQMF